MKKVLIFLSLAIGSSVIYAQETDDVYINTQFLPSADVGSFVKMEAGISVPLLNTSKDKLSIGGYFQNNSLNFEDKNVPFETDDIETFNVFGLKFNYQRSLSDNWAINFMGGSQISSNFDESEIKSDDIFFNALVTVDKFNEENNTQWTLGATYDIKYGLYFPIPIVTYAKRISDAWAYKLGVPDSRVKWTLSDHHNFEGFATLTGFTGNINDEIEIYKEDYEGTLRQTTVLLGLGYNYTFWDNFKVTVNGGYSVYNHMQVQDYDHDEIYDFDISNSLYISAGIKYTFDNKTNIKSVY